MEVWIEVLTPKQALLFEPAAPHAKGHALQGFGSTRLAETSSSQQECLKKLDLTVVTPIVVFRT